MIIMGRILAKKDPSKHDEALQSVLDGIKGLEALKLRPLLSERYRFLAELYVDIGEYDAALEYLRKAESESQDMGIDFNLSYAKIHIGSTMAKMKPSQSDAAEEYILHGIKIAKDNEYKPPLARGYLCLGEFYVDTNQKEKASDNLKKAEIMYQEMGMGLYLDQTKEILARLQS